MPPTKAKLTPAQREAVGLYRRGACVRIPDESRLDEGSRAYKKGWEIRIYASAGADLKKTVRTLTDAGIPPGRPYRKSQGRWVVPVYGFDRVDQLMKWDEGR